MRHMLAIGVEASSWLWGNWKHGVKLMECRFETKGYIQPVRNRLVHRHVVTESSAFWSPAAFPSSGTSTSLSWLQELFWPTILFMKNNLFIFTQCLPNHRNQTKQSLCWHWGCRSTPLQGHLTLAPLLFGTTSCYLSSLLPQLPPLKQIS